MKNDDLGNLQIKTINDFYVNSADSSFFLLSKIKWSTDLLRAENTASEYEKL